MAPEASIDAWTGNDVIPREILEHAVALAHAHSLV